MDVELRDYRESDRAVIVSMMNDFGDYFVGIDPERRLIRAPDYGEFYTDRMISRTAAERGAVFLAAADSRVLGFGAGVIEEPEPANESETHSPKV